MISKRCLAVVSVVALIVLVPASSLRAQQTRPVQLALVTPIQIFPEEDAIGGVRLSLLYGRNVSVAGFDLGLVNHTTTGTTKGVQWGIVGIAERRFVGWQGNYVNVVNGTFEGFQSGLVNYSGEATGFLLGWVNYTKYTNGLQLAIVNYTKRMKGIQVGLLNIIEEGGFLPIFPIVNWSFE